MSATRRQVLLAAVGMLACCATAAGQDSPRILFLGDSIHQRMVDATAKELTGKALIERPRAPRAFDTGSALEHLDDWLGDGDWDLIYFNFGLGDLFYKDPRTREIRALSKHSGGVRVTTSREYEQNLERIVQRLEATGAKLLWASTTPLVNVDAFPRYTGNLYDAGSEVELNRIAAEVMQRHDVPILDVHTYIVDQFKADEPHPAFDRYDKALMKKKPLHEAVLRALNEYLGLPPLSL